MTALRRFLLGELLWGTVIFLLVLPITMLSSDAHGGVDYVRWLVRALTLAAFPAGVMAAAAFVQPRPLRPLMTVLAAAAAIGILLFVLTAVVVLAADSLTLPVLLERMRTTDASWETRNHAAWTFYGTLIIALQPALLALIGIQTGAWARHAVPPVLRRPLYWLVGLGLMMTGYGVSDSTYETVVLHTSAYVDFAAFYTLLIPLGICAGLALPTLALLRGDAVRGSDS